MKQFSGRHMTEKGSGLHLNNDILSCVRCLSFTARGWTACAKTASLRSSAQTHIPWLCVAALTRSTPPASGNFGKDGGWLATTVQMRWKEGSRVNESQRWKKKRKKKQSSCLRGRRLMNKLRSCHGERAKRQTNCQDTVKEKNKESSKMFLLKGGGVVGGGGMLKAWMNQDPEQLTNKSGQLQIEQLTLLRLESLL